MHIYMESRNIGYSLHSQLIIKNSYVGMEYNNGIGGRLVLYVHFRLLYFPLYLNIFFIKM